MRDILGPWLGPVFSFLMTLICIPAEAATVRVPQHYPTIQEGLDAAAEHDTVLVSPGVYTDFRTWPGPGSGTVSACVAPQRFVVLIGEAGPLETEIRMTQVATSDRATFALYVAEGISSKVEGFTIAADSGATGGCLARSITLDKPATLNFRQCTFRDLVAGMYYGSSSTRGAAIRSDYTTLILDSVRFERCRAGLGGAISAKQIPAGTQVKVTNCVFLDCTGGAFWIESLSGFHPSPTTVQIEHSVFESNTGGGLNLDFGIPTEFNAARIVDCTFRGNVGGGATIAGNGNVSIERTRFEDNSSSTDAGGLTVRGLSVADAAIPMQVVENTFVRNTGPRGACALIARPAQLLRNAFSDGTGTSTSALTIDPVVPGYFDQNNMVVVTANLFVGNGPGNVMSLDNNEQITASCNFAWQNTGLLPDILGITETDPQLCGGPPEEFRVAASSPCLPENNIFACGNVGGVEIGCPSLGTSTLVIDSAPPFRTLFLDGRALKAPVVHVGTPGTFVGVGVDSQQFGIPGERWSWNSWSDGGERFHDAIIDNDPRLVRAVLDTEYRLQTFAYPPGTGTPSPPESWFSEGTVVSISAVANLPWSFHHWSGQGSGSYSGQSNSATVQLQSPITETAVFATDLIEAQVNIVAGDGGSVTPSSGLSLIGTDLMIQAIPDPGYTFAGWEGNGIGSYSGPLPNATIAVLSPIEERANFEPIEAKFTFSLSSSATNSGENHSAPLNTWRQIWLWAQCLGKSISTFEADVTSTLPITQFVPDPGILDGGSGAHLHLLIPNCPIGEEVNVRLGSWYVLDTGGDVCLGPGPAGLPYSVLDCATPVGTRYESPGIVGFSSNSSPPCFRGTHACPGDGNGSGDATSVPTSIADIVTMEPPRPNPFLGTVQFLLRLSGNVNVSLAIYDVRGRELRKLLEGASEPGIRTLVWDGRDDTGAEVAAGIYFARCVAGQQVMVRKVVRLNQTR